MKRIRSILLVALTAVVTLSGAELDQGSRKILLDHLNQSSSEFAASIKGLTPEQWSYKPSPEVWSVAECAEHIALSEDFIREMIETKMLAAPPPSRPAAEQQALDGKVIKMITDRSFKAKAPEPLRPTRQFSTPEAALQKFQENRAKTIALAKSRDDLRDHAGPHPAFKELDTYQWLLYLSGHTMRHTAQLQEVKATPGFPK